MIKWIGSLMGLAENGAEYVAEREKNLSIRALLKENKRLRKAKGYAQDYFECEDRLLIEDNPKKIERVKRKMKARKARFREID